MNCPHCGGTGRAPKPPESRTLFDGVSARDEALDRVGGNAGPEFMAAVLAAARSFPPDADLTGEDVRLRAEKDFGARPHHHNAWGAAVASCVRRGVLVKIEGWAHLKRLRSHARRTPKYKRAPESQA